MYLRSANDHARANDADRRGVSSKIRTSRSTTSSARFSLALPSGNILQRCHLKHSNMHIDFTSKMGKPLTCSPAG